MTHRPALPEWFLRDMRINDRPPPVSDHYANGKACRAIGQLYRTSENHAQNTHPRTKSKLLEEGPLQRP